MYLFNSNPVDIEIVEMLGVLNDYLEIIEEKETDKKTRKKEEFNIQSSHLKIGDSQTLQRLPIEKLEFYFKKNGVDFELDKDVFTNINNSPLFFGIPKPFSVGIIRETNTKNLRNKIQKTIEFIKAKIYKVEDDKKENKKAKILLKYDLERHILYFGKKPSIFSQGDLGCKIMDIFIREDEKIISWDQIMEEFSDMDSETIRKGAKENKKKIIDACINLNKKIRKDLNFDSDIVEQKRGEVILLADVSKM